MNETTATILTLVVLITLVFLFWYLFYRLIFLLRRIWFGFLRLKKMRALLVVMVFAWILYFWLNAYETKNYCTFEFDDYYPFISCTPEYNRFGFWWWVHDCWMFGCSKKPLILLYPERDTEVNVKLNYRNKFSATFPEYQDQISGWSVVAHPDGTLHDISSNQDTYGLFWEGNSGNIHFNMSQWFIIPWSEVREFLYQKLTEIGLNTKERSDFIMYWYPLLQKYRYVQITFAGTDYTDTAKLDISPRPDSLLRVFMVARPLDIYSQIPEQKFEKFQRKWFSVVEWWGTIIH